MPDFSDFTARIHHQNTKTSVPDDKEVTMSLKHNIKLGYLLVAATVAILLQPNYVSAQSCLSWLWGGENQETTIAPPFVPNTTAAQPVRSSYVNPSYPIGTPTYSVSYPSVTPSVTYQQQTVYRPEVESEWSYSRIERKNYKPVQVVDPVTGAVSTVMAEENSKTLLPWPHRKETVTYKPITVTTPASSQIVSRPVVSNTVYETYRPITPAVTTYTPIESTTTYKPIATDDRSSSVYRATTRIVEAPVETRIVDYPNYDNYPDHTAEPLIEIKKNAETNHEVKKAVSPQPLPKTGQNSDALPLPPYEPMERTIRREVPAAFTAPAVPEKVTTPDNELRYQPTGGLFSEPQVTESATEQPKTGTVSGSPFTTPIPRNRSYTPTKRTPPPYEGSLLDQMNKTFPAG